MTTFEGGPAMFASLDLRRLPIMLRVVVSPVGKVDALDQLNDVAADDEKIYVYMMLGRPGHWHGENPSSGKRLGGPFARYRFLQQQPDEGCIRTNERWAKWCDDNRSRLEQMKKAWDMGYV